VREVITRHKAYITNTTRGGRRARHPKTTLPHAPSSRSASSGRFVGPFKNYFRKCEGLTLGTWLASRTSRTTMKSVDARSSLAPFADTPSLGAESGVSMQYCRGARAQLTPFSTPLGVMRAMPRVNLSVRLSVSPKQCASAAVGQCAQEPSGAGKYRFYPRTMADPPAGQDSSLRPPSPPGAVEHHDKDRQGEWDSHPHPGVKPGSSQPGAFDHLTRRLPNVPGKRTPLPPIATDMMSPRSRQVSSP